MGVIYKNGIPYGGAPPAGDCTDYTLDVTSEHQLTLSDGSAVVQSLALPCGPVQTDGNWTYREYADGSFDAWYMATKQTIVITAASGSLYRSDLRTLTLPSALGEVSILHADVNASHNNYPVWGVLASLSGANVNYYAMSGGSRSSSPNYIVTAHVFGRKGGG